MHVCVHNHIVFDLFSSQFLYKPMLWTVRGVFMCQVRHFKSMITIVINSYSMPFIG